MEQSRRSQKGRAALARRATIILRSAQGEKVPLIARGLGLCQATVRTWIRRYTERGLAGLAEKPLSGRPPVDSEVERGKIIQLALTPPKKLDKPFCHWTLDLLQEALNQDGCSIRRSQIRRVLRAEGVKWQKEQTWFASPDPEFAVKRGRLSGFTRSPLREAT